MSKLNIIEKKSGIIEYKREIRRNEWQEWEWERKREKNESEENGRKCLDKNTIWKTEKEK